MATVGRKDEVESFLASLDSQTYRKFELIVVDQNLDDRLVPILNAYKDRFPLLHLRVSKRGASRARNMGLKHVGNDIVAFPDDDCCYPPCLLETVARFFASHPSIDGLTGRCIDEGGKPSAGRFEPKAGHVNKYNVWTCAIETTIFSRTKSLGGIFFDETLGVGAGTLAGAGEGTDYLLQLLNRGASLYYDPDLTIVHPSPILSYDTKVMQRAYSYGCGMGYVLRKHRYPLRSKMKWLIRPFGGAALFTMFLKLPVARYHWNQFKGRLRGMAWGA